MVRVVPATNLIASLFSADSTRVLPHQPSPTIPALIIRSAPRRNCSQKGLAFSLPIFDFGQFFLCQPLSGPSLFGPSLFGPSLFGPRQHGERDARQHPEHAIFDAA